MDDEKAREEEEKFFKEAEKRPDLKFIVGFEVDEGEDGDIGEMDFGEPKLKEDNEKTIKQIDIGKNNKGMF